MAYLQCGAILIKTHIMFFCKSPFKNGVDAKTECVFFTLCSLKFVECRGRTGPETRTLFRDIV